MYQIPFKFKGSEGLWYTTLLYIFVSSYISREKRACKLVPKLVELGELGELVELVELEYMVNELGGMAELADWLSPASPPPALSVM